MKIIYENSDGGVSVVIPAPGKTPADVVNVVPDDTIYEIVPDSVVPTDRTFRGAWRKDGDAIDIPIPAAKVSAHDIRRQKRAEEFAPWDEIIRLQIPGDDLVQAEAYRVTIREKYATLQDLIDAAGTTVEITSALATI